MPTKRPQILVGTTYKFKIPSSDDAFYVTINDIEEDGCLRPYEIFVNSKNLMHHSWMVAITRLLSAVFRTESNPSFVIEELQSIYDPEGGYFRDGVYVPSMPAELGLVIKKHLQKLGILEAEKAVEAKPAEVKAAAEPAPRGMICPKCGQPSVVKAEGCQHCTKCDYSKCG